MRTDIRPTTLCLGNLLIAVLLFALTAGPTAAQDVPTDGLLLRLQDDALDAASELTALAAELDRPTPYTAAAIHPHAGRWSVTISQGTLDEETPPSRFLHDETAEFFFYDRVLDEKERRALQGYVAAQYDAPTPESSDGLDQGINVQGNWSIEVRDPDGRLAKRREFENELTPDGANALANVVGGNLTVGLFEVVIDDVCYDSENDQNTRCRILEESDTYSGSNASHNLFVGTRGTGTDDYFTLDGTATAWAPNDGGATINRIATYISICAPHVEHDECGASSQGLKFTETELVDPVVVEDEQLVSIEVVVSFN